MNTDERKNNGNTILLTVIGVATLLVALVGATFAYFSATVTTTAKESMIIKTVAPIGLTYTGEDVSLPNAIPTAHADSTFTVKNTKEESDTRVLVDQLYDLVLVVEANEFTTALHSNNQAEDATALQDQLRIAITGTSDGTTTIGQINNGTYFNLTDGTTTAAAGVKFPIVTGQRINAGETHTYDVDVDFAELNISQDANQGKTFRAHIDIENVKSVQNNG